MFATLMQSIYTCISFPLNVLEDVFGALGLSFFVIFVMMIFIGFFVRNFISVFLK